MLYCIVLYISIYITPLAVHTNQRRSQCERPREKKEVLRQPKEAFGQPVNKEERIEGGSWFLDTYTCICLFVYVYVYVTVCACIHTYIYVSKNKYVVRVHCIICACLFICNRAFFLCVVLRVQKWAKVLHK